MYVIVDAQIALSFWIAEGEADSGACGTAAARTAASESSEIVRSMETGLRQKDPTSMRRRECTRHG
jgi:hypothetical protein